MEASVTNPEKFGTIAQALRLIELLRLGPGDQLLTELATQSGFTFAAVHRLLRSLVAAGLVVQTPGTPRYSLGTEFVRLSQNYLTRQPVVQALSPYLVELRHTTKATIQVALLVHGCVVYVDRMEGEHASELYRIPHRVHPALDTAAGRILLRGADLDSNELGRPLVYTGSHLALADPYVPDSVEVAVPVSDERGRVVAALSASDHCERFTPEVIAQRVVPHLLRATQAVRERVSRT